jgi:serine/threonine protein phosphatase 1
MIKKDRMLFWRRDRAKPGSSSENRTLSVAEGERIYAIGDVHGHLDLLKALLVKIDEDASKRPPGRQIRLIFMGDYIDRGDQSSEVIAFLIHLQQQCGEHVVFLAGNHEAALLSFLNDPSKGRDWLNWGGKQTLASYGVAPPLGNFGPADLVAVRDALAHAMADHAEFLHGLARFTTSGSVVFAHAALDPAYPLEQQPDAALLWGKVTGKARSGLPNYRLVHGHFPSAKPVSTPHHICIDTGAYYTGTLTAVRLDEEEAFLNVSIYDIQD